MPFLRFSNEQLRKVLMSDVTDPATKDAIRAELKRRRSVLRPQ